MEWLGYISSMLIGVSLGLIGGGGSILTVPVLVYLFSVDALTATAYSLFVVGFTSAVGSVAYFRKGLVDLKTTLLFGTPSIVLVLLTRSLIVPAIPPMLFSIAGFAVSKALLTMLVFALLMIFASYRMISSCCGNMSEHPGRNRWLVLLQGALVGLVTGLVGAGGGFLIIPALVLMLRLPMKTAVGTSLLIIAVNSLIGFMVGPGQAEIRWHLLLLIALAALAGMLIGLALSRRIDGARLRPAFGWFVLVMGLFILLKELFFNSYV